MTAEGVASLRAARAANAAKSSGSSKSSSSGSGRRVLVPVGKTKTGKTVWGKAPTGTKFYQKTAGGGYRYGGKTYSTAAEAAKAEAKAQVLAEKEKAEAKEQAEIEKLKAATTEKEKDVMRLQYAIQKGMFSEKAAAKARAAQQELMKSLPEKKPVKTAFELGGKTFVGTYGLKKVYEKPTEKKAPKISTKAYLDYTSKIKKEKKPTIPSRQKEWEETIDIITPAPTLYTGIGKGFVTEYKAPTGKWAGAMYSFRKGLETKEIEAIRKGDTGMAGIYGFGSAVTYPFRTPESTKELAISFGKGVGVGAGITALGMATGPIVPTVLLYGSSIYGATQVPKLQEQIAEAKFHSPVAYREKIAETGEHAAAAVGGAYVGSLLVPATIAGYKEWHHKWITEKGATTKKGDYIWKKGYYSEKALKDWEKTLAESKFISEAQKQTVLKRVGGKPAVYKKQDFFSLKEEQLGLPSQPIQTQLIPKKHFIEPTTKVQLELSEAARIQAAMKTNQYLGKWMPRPSLKPKADQLPMSFPKFKGHMEQYQLYDTTGESFFESSYFKTGYYKPVPRLLLEYKPVGKLEMFTQRIVNIKYPSAPKVFVGKKAQLIHVPPSHVWEKGDIYTGLIPEKKPIVVTKPSVVEKPSFKFGFTPLVFEAEKEKAGVAEKAGAGLAAVSISQLKPASAQALKPEITFAFEQKFFEPTKTEVEPKLKVEVKVAQKQRAVTAPVTKVPTVKVPDVKIPEFKFEIKPRPEPEPEPAYPFGFGLPSMPRVRLPRAVKPRARPRPRRREVTVDPFAGLYSVQVSEFMFGRATHPARTKKEKKKFKKRIRESAMFFPTVELEKFAVPKI